MSFILLLTDKICLWVCLNQFGNNKALFGIEVKFDEFINTLKESKISIDELYIKGDKGFITSF